MRPLEGEAPQAPSGVGIRSPVAPQGTQHLRMQHVHRAGPRRGPAAQRGHFHRGQGGQAVLLLPVHQPRRHAAAREHGNGKAALDGGPAARPGSRCCRPRGRPAAGTRARPMQRGVPGCRTRRRRWATGRAARPHAAASRPTQRLVKQQGAAVGAIPRHHGQVISPREISAAA